MSLVNDPVYRRIRKLTGKAIGDFKLIEAGDRKRRPGSSYCSFCARLRRGVLYTVA